MFIIQDECRDLGLQFILKLLKYNLNLFNVHIQIKGGKFTIWKINNFLSETSHKT